MEVHGNCSFIETENSKILVDFGVSCKKVTTALDSIGFNLQDIDAIFLTHEHSDHTYGLNTLCKKYSIPIIGTKGTLENLKQNVPDNLKISIKNDNTYDLKDITVHSFSIPHDAADPCGFTFFHNKKKIAIVTDVGHIENNLYDNLAGSDFAMIEANYDQNMLLSSPYPNMLKRRILSDFGHLSNEDASEIVNEISTLGVKNIKLAHLSRENNFPELAYETVKSEFDNKINFDSLNITVAKRNEIDPIIEI